MTCKQSSIVRGSSLVPQSMPPTATRLDPCETPPTHSVCHLYHCHCSYIDHCCLCNPYLSLAARVSHGINLSHIACRQSNIAPSECNGQGPKSCRPEHCLLVVGWWLDCPALHPGFSDPSFLVLGWNFNLHHELDATSEPCLQVVVRHQAQEARRWQLLHADKLGGDRCQIAAERGRRPARGPPPTRR